MLGKPTLLTMSVELNIMKQVWNVTSSDADYLPIVNASQMLNKTTRVIRYQTDINGLVSNQKLPNEPKLVASAAW
jgi:hypothetical protein